MNAMIVIASRYGATAQGAQWIAERLTLDGVPTQVHRAEDAPPPEAQDLIVLGSGLYSHKLLPALDRYIDTHIQLLCGRKLALFASAMRTTPLFVRGQAHGGLSQLDYLFRKLGKALLHAEMLGGQMVFSRLSSEDAAALGRFYAMLRLTPAEIERRKAPRTLMAKCDYWAFAETVLKRAQEEP